MMTGESDYCARLACFIRQIIMNIFTRTNRITAQMLAVVTAFAMILSAFPVHFFVAEAGIYVTLFGPIDQDVTDVGGEFASGVIDARAHENLLFSFDYDSTELDGTDDSFTYGWRSSGTDYDLGTVVGVSGTTDPSEIGSVSKSLPEVAAVADLEVYVRVDAVPGADSDEVKLTNLTVTGNPLVVLDSQDAVRICHSAKGKNYADISPNVDSIITLPNGHKDHAPDIIPDFWYDIGDGATYYAGNNWPDTSGIYDNDCQDPKALYGTITVTKVVEGGNATPADFDLFVDGIEVESGDLNDFVAGKKKGISYVMSEANGPDHYELTALQCVKGDNDPKLGDLETGEIVMKLKKDQHIDCTFTNTYVPPPTKEIEMCKKDVTGAPIAGWGMTLSNGDETYELLTEKEDGCVTQEVNPEDGPWYVTEEDRDGWELDDILTENGRVFDEKEVGCEFFGLRAVADDAQVKCANARCPVPPPPEFTCTFVNEEIPQEPPICDYGFGPENLLANGSFEEPEIDSSWSLTSIADWVVTKVSDATGVDGELWRGLFGGASDGEQNVELDSTEPTVVAQTVSTIPGATYELRFDFSPRPKTGLADNDVDAQVDGSVLMNVSGDGTVIKENNWTTYTETFEAVGTTTEISFKDNGTANRVGSLIDNAVLCLVEEPAEVTVVAHKIVCEDEADLPNWGTGGPNIDENTASDWVAKHDSCRLAEGWEFEWGPQTAFDPGDTATGTAGDPWTTFGPTDVNGLAMSTLSEEELGNNAHLWFREVLQDGYIPFTHGPNGKTNVDDYTAEVYCHTDVKNYDNFDRIDGVALDETYYCVAWNVSEAPEMCEVTLVSDTTDFVVEKDANAQALSWIHPAWTAFIPGATWIWGDDPVVDPSVDETQTFLKKFGFVGNVTNATLEVATDNGHSVMLNGNTSHDGGSSFSSAVSYDVTGEINQGNNDLSIAVTNKALGTDPRKNPAGLLYKLHIEGEVTTDQDCVVPYEEEPECIIEGYKYDETGEPLEGWMIGLAERFMVYHEALTVQSQEEEPEFGEPRTIGTDETDENGYYCIEPSMVDGKLLTKPAKIEYGVYEVMKDGWQFVKAEVDDSERVPAGDNPFDVLIPVDLDEDKQVDFYNREQTLTCDPEVNLIANGDFETPEVTDDAGWDIFDLSTYPSLAWMVEWVNLSPRAPDEASLEFHAGVNGWLPAEGEQYAELDSDWEGPGFGGSENASVKISQNIETIPGETYVLSWNFSPRPGRAFQENKLEVYVDGDKEASNQETGVGLDNTVWTPDSYEFVADTSSTEIMFMDAGNGNSSGTFIDDVALYCVPEDNGDGDNELSCDFTASDYTANTGSTVDLTWSTTEADHVEIDQGINDVDPNGSTTVDVTDDITYILTAYQNYGEENETSVTCDVSIDAEHGGGGHRSGGSSRRDNSNDEPETGTPQVLGEQVSLVPAGAPDTGAGGSQVPQPATKLTYLLSLAIRKTRLNEKK